MSSFIQIVIAAAIVGFFVGKTTKVSGNDPLVFYLCMSIAGLMLGVFIALRVGKTESEGPFDLYGLTSVVVVLTVAFYVMYFHDDDGWRKRLKKKTSQALEKLVATVKELAPTPAPRPIPIPIRA